MNLRDLLLSGNTILFDGAMGTQLDKRGLMSRGATNLVAPDAVLEIHREYLDCPVSANSVPSVVENWGGCRAITANTLTMNRIYIETHDVGVDVGEVNRAGVEIARRAAADRAYVLGNMCSTGQMLEPYGVYTEDQFYDAFKEQAGVLAESGADGFLIETMFDLRETLCALRACRQYPDLPAIVSMAFSTTANGGRTVMGDSAADCAMRLADAGAEAVGANCGTLDPFQMAELVATMKSCVSLPILAQPNAGTPQLVDGKTVFDMGPEAFARGVTECLRAGATIIGGCCGTSPDHIRAVAETLAR